MEAQEFQWLWIIYFASSMILGMVLWRFTHHAHSLTRATFIICVLLIILTPKRLYHQENTYLAPMLISTLFVYWFEPG